MKKFIAFLSLLLFSTLIYYGCQQQELRTYTDAELQKNKDLLEKLWNGGDIAIVDTMYSADCVYHSADYLDAKGPEEIKRFVKWVYTAYPDFAVVLDETMKLKDRVVFTYKASGTNNGPLGENMPATGKKMSFNGVSILKMENGKIIEEWNYYNQLPIYKQLGYVLTLPEEKKE
jgi:steroid delta-isomerase-like uncharacterized protein